MKAKVIVELGVELGISTQALLLACKKGGGHLWSVDTGVCPEVQRWVKQAGFEEYWTFTMINDLKFVETWKKSIDLLFIDTTHTFNQTLNELEAYSPHVTGNIFLHDSKVKMYQVDQAIKTFINRHKEWKYMEIPNIKHGLARLTR